MIFFSLKFKLKDKSFHNGSERNRNVQLFNSTSRYTYIHRPTHQLD